MSITSDDSRRIVQFCWSANSSSFSVIRPHSYSSIAYAFVEAIVVVCCMPVSHLLAPYYYTLDSNGCPFSRHQCHTIFHLSSRETFIFRLAWLRSLCGTSHHLVRIALVPTAYMSFNSSNSLARIRNHCSQRSVSLLKTPPAICLHAYHRSFRFLHLIRSPRGFHWPDQRIPKVILGTQLSRLWLHSYRCLSRNHSLLRSQVGQQPSDSTASSLRTGNLNCLTPAQIRQEYHAMVYHGL